MLVSVLHHLLFEFLDASFSGTNELVELGQIACKCLLGLLILKSLLAKGTEARSILRIAQVFLLWSGA